MIEAVIKTDGQREERQSERKEDREEREKERMTDRWADRPREGTQERGECRRATGSARLLGRNQSIRDDKWLLSSALFSISNGIL